MAAFNPHECGDLSLFLCTTNIGYGSGQHQIVWVTLNRAVNGIDHVERSSRCTGPNVIWFDVDGKELCCQTTFLHAIEAGAIWNRRRATQIVVVVGHWCGDVVMTINDNGLAMDGKRAFPELLIASGLLF